VLIYDDGKVSACSCRDSEGVMEIGDITKESLHAIRNGLGDRENEKLLIGGATPQELADRARAHVPQ
jgi:hypothetical protein